MTTGQNDSNNSYCVVVLWYCGSSLLKLFLFKPLWGEERLSNKGKWEAGSEVGWVDRKGLKVSLIGKCCCFPLHCVVMPFELLLN